MEMVGLEIRKISQQMISLDFETNKMTCFNSFLGVFFSDDFGDDLFFQKMIFQGLCSIFWGVDALKTTEEREKKKRAESFPIESWLFM